jgi:AAA+ superfamily predicted ATPase
MKTYTGIYFYISKKGIITIAGPKGAKLNIGANGVSLSSDKEPLQFELEKTADLKIQHKETLKGSDEKSISINMLEEPEVKVLGGVAELKAIFEDAINKRNEQIEQIKQSQNKLDNLLSNLESKENSLLSKLFTSQKTFEKLDKEIQETAAYIVELNKQLEESKIDIQTTFDAELQNEYQMVSKTFQQLGQSNKLWYIENQIQNDAGKSGVSHYVIRKDAKFSLGNADFINSAIAGLHIQIDSGIQIFIYPSFYLTIDASGALSLFDLNEIYLWFNTQRFQEMPNDVPNDATISDNASGKSDKKGRSKKSSVQTNQIIELKYGVYEIKAIGLNQLFYISNYEYSKIFAGELLNYLAQLPYAVGSSINHPFLGIKVKKQDFERMKSFADNHLMILDGIKKNKSIMDQIFAALSMKSRTFETPAEFIDFYMAIDLMKCFDLAVNISDLKTKEAFALMYVLAKSHKAEIDYYAQYTTIYSLNVVTIYEKYVVNMRPELEMELADHELFRLARIFATFDQDLQEQYLTSLYRFASIVVKMDGTVTPKEESALKRIMSLNPSSNPISQDAKPTEPKQAISDASNEKSIEETLEELNSLTGLTEVKKEINTLINFIKVQKARSEKGLKTSSLSYHIVFMGNPGTGKTTVARIVAQIYKSLGVLSQGQLVETDRSGLIAEYVGQTAVKVNKTVDSALHGVLFIDEAYSIVGDAQDSFGREAVSTLIKRMEDDRDKLIVILAGYTKEMQDFIDTNPGFKSRFNRYIEFSDYTPDELIKIFEGFCKKLDYKPTTEAMVKLSESFTKAYEARDQSFGNGRFVRNTFEKAMERQANRIAGIGELTNEVLTTITVDDIP